jgi:hypothetical protein
VAVGGLWTASIGVVTLVRVYLRQLHIENIRTFEQAQLMLEVPTGRAPVKGEALSNVTLLIGENGCGKTTLLRCLALGALAPIIVSGSGYVPRSLVRRVHGVKPSPASIDLSVVLHGQDGVTGVDLVEDSLILDLVPTNGFADRFGPYSVADTRALLDQVGPPDDAALWDETSPAFFMVGYGATRRVEPDQNVSEELRRKARVLRYGRVAGLFEEGVTLMPLSAWLPRMRHENPGRHRQVVNLMNRILDRRAVLHSEAVDGEYLFDFNGSRLPFHALSDGYRAFIGWVADLLYHVCMGAPSGAKLVETRGVVLVDEVDLHLHPEWQARVVGSIANALPAMQFILTSHSPLVVGTLWSRNLRVVRWTEGRTAPCTVVEGPSEEVYGKSADQLLTSRDFGLGSARTPEFATQLNKAAKATDLEGTLRFMRLLSHGGAALSESMVVEAPAEPRKRRKTRALR